MLGILILWVLAWDLEFGIWVWNLVVCEFGIEVLSWDLEYVFLRLEFWIFRFLFCGFVYLIWCFEF